MEFLKWTLKESLFHYLMLTAMFVITMFWDDGSDKTLARVAIGFIASVLILGKYRYWKKMKRAGLM
jgi:hypothetical protein